MSWSVLPWDLTSFVGREEERETLRALAESQSETPCIVSLVGMAGVGKTRLARVASEEVRRHFPGGLVYCEFGERPEEPADVLARALGDGTALVPGPAVEATASALMRRERSLILLDHAGSHEVSLLEVLSAWIGSGSHMFIVTSRTPLRLRGTRRISLGPLGPEESLALLKERAAELGAVPIADDEQALALVRGVGGSPLAIELVAGALDTRSPTELLAALARDRSLLETADVDVPERHQTLERVMDETWSQLGDAEQRSLLLACCFEERFCADDYQGIAELVVESDESPRSFDLDTLSARGLVARGPDGFEILACLRDYVREQGDSATRFAFAKAHAQHVQALAAAGDLRPGELIRAARELHARASDTESAGLAIDTLLSVCEELATCESARLRGRLLDQAAQLADSYPEAQRSEQVRLELARWARAAGQVERAANLLDGIDREGRTGQSWRYHLSRALVDLDRGLGEQAEKDLDRALDAAESDLARAHVMATRLAHALIGTEPVDEREGLAAWKIFESEGAASAANKILVNLALSALHRADHTATDARLDTALAQAVFAGDRVVEAGCLLFRGLSAMDRGAFADAAESLAASEALALDLGRRSLWSDAVGYGAIAQLLAGQEAGRARLASHLSELIVHGMTGSGGLFAAILHFVDGGAEPTSMVRGAERPLIARAIELLRSEAAPHEAIYGVQARLAARVWQLGARVHGAVSKRESIFIAQDGTRCTRAGQEIDLRRRGPLRNILAALAQARRDGAGPVAPEELIAAGWPDEHIQAEAARTRLYNAIGALRSMGLRGVIATTPEGYCLAEEFAITEVEGARPPESQAPRG